MGACRSAMALVRVKRGSTWMSVAPEPCPQTGDTRTVSYPGLILDGHDAKAAHELLLDMIPFVIQGGATQREQGRRHVDHSAIREALNKSLVACLGDQLGNAIHRPFQVPHLPLCGPGSTMQHLGGAVRVHMQLVDGSPLRTERAFIVWTARIAFDIDDCAIDRMHERGASHGAVGADTRGHFGVLNAQVLGARGGWCQVDAKANERADRRAGACTRG